MCKGTKQGGLSSLFIFNIFYKELLDILEIQEGGISIGNRKYNVICYADDLLLLNSTVTGLQGLINKADAYIVKITSQQDATQLGATQIDGFR